MRIVYNKVMILKIIQPITEENMEPALKSKAREIILNKYELGITLRLLKMIL